MNEAEIKKAILSNFSEIRPRLIKTIHDQKLEEYKEEYKRTHNKKPSKDMLHLFSQMLLQNKIAMKEADQMIDDLAEKIYKENKKQRRTRKVVLGIVNTFIFVIILNLGISFCALYLKSIGIDILKGYDPLIFANFADAVLVILVSIFYYIFLIFQE